jgi:hypothetical protein
MDLVSENESGKRVWLSLEMDSRTVARIPEGSMGTLGVLEQAEKNTKRRTERMWNLMFRNAKKCGHSCQTNGELAGISW